MPDTILDIKFKSGLKQVSFSKLLSQDFTTEKSNIIRQSRGREIYIYGITVQDENSVCIGNFRKIDLTINEVKENEHKKQHSVNLKKSPYQVAKNFFFIDSYSQLTNCDDLELILNRSEDINSKCDRSIPETYSLYYYFD